jgi:hypothetical protein
MEKKQYNPVEEFEKCLTSIFEDAKRKFGVDLRAKLDTDEAKITSALNGTSEELTKQQEDVMLLRRDE